MRHYLKPISANIKKILETIIQFIMILLFTKLNCVRCFMSNDAKANKLIILGNGPSLEEDMQNNVCEINSINSDVLCLNSFANSKHYNRIKPKYYVLIDPLYFKQITNVERIDLEKEKLQNNIISNTEWPINFYVPRYYLKCSFVQSLRVNPNITITPINNVPLFGGYECIKFFLFKFRLANPVFQNVLVAAIFIGIQKKYKSIILFGSDHNWIKNINVMDNNQVILNDQHNNRLSVNNIVLTDENGKSKHLHIFLNQISIMFQEYHTLNKYSKTCGANIVNFTKDSFIDAFEKLHR